MTAGTGSDLGSETAVHAGGEERLTVLQAKFAAYLSWSQPFLHSLISGLDEHVNNVVLCNRTENLNRFPVPNVERIPTRYLVKPRLGVLAASYLRRTWRPDVMHGHFGWSGLRLLLMKQMMRVPLVVTFGGRDVGLQMLLPDFDRLYAAMLGGTDAIICVSKDLRSKLIDAGADPDRIHVVYRGTDLSRFEYVDRRARPADDPVRALMVGRIVEKKGHRYALEALEALAAKDKKVHLTVVGEGEAYHEIRRLRRRLGLQGEVELVGSTDHHGVRQHMRESDFLVHCSITPESGDVEGIPNVVVEAQAMGLPVIGTIHGGIGEAVRDGETGLLVPERAVVPLTEAIEALMDRERRLRFGRQARDFVEANFNIKSQVDQHLAIYEKVVATTRSDPEWKVHNWLPDDYSALVDCTLLAQNIRHPTEFSIAELLERLVWARRLEGRLNASSEFEADPDGAARAFLPEASQLSGGEVDGERRVGLPRALFSVLRAVVRRALGRSEKGATVETTLEQLYNLKGYMPQAVKFPMKIGLGRILAWAIERRHKARHGQIGTLEEVDRRVFEFFRAGGDLDAYESAHEQGPQESLPPGSPLA
ncbi:MAG: glycosyltransferase family 4 protein [bacterium]|nr:glycosyltransferase family 4 protein [bacterium]